MRGDWRPLHLGGLPEISFALAWQRTLQTLANEGTFSGVITDFNAAAPLMYHQRRIVRNLCVSVESHWA